MKILCAYVGKESAVGAYRLHWPLAALSAHGQHPTATYHLDKPVPPGQPRFTHALREADICVHHSVLAMASPDILRPAPDIMAGPPEVSMDAKVKGPAAFVVDIDDAAYHVDPLNPAFETHGIYDHEGKPLRPGDAVMGTRLDGSTFIIQKDGMLQDGAEVTFSIAQNRNRCRQLQRTLMHYPGITVSTPRMQQYIEEVSGREDAFLLPNLMYRKMYPEFESPKRSVPTILWQGGASHYHDLTSIYEPLVYVLKKHPEARMIVFGQEFRWFNEALPLNQVTYVPWVEFNAYHTTMRTFGHNINLCPLRPDRFSAHKSCIKWYESSALHYPAATLAAKTPPFSDEIVDGETGLLYGNKEEFADKLERLIEDPLLRQGLASNAHEWVWRNRDEALWIPKLETYYESLVKRQYDRAIKRYAVTV